MAATMDGGHFFCIHVRYHGYFKLIVIAAKAEYAMLK
jgi:hypothetical protein